MMQIAADSCLQHSPHRMHGGRLIMFVCLVAVQIRCHPIHRPLDLFLPPNQPVFRASADLADAG